MRTKLYGWYESVPNRSKTSKLAPHGFLDGALSKALLRVYSPSKYLPAFTDDDFEECRMIATTTIRLDRQFFRDGGYDSTSALYISCTWLARRLSVVRNTCTLDCRSTKTVTARSRNRSTHARLSFGAWWYVLRRERISASADNLASELKDMKSPRDMNSSFDFLNTTTFYDS